LWKSQLDQRGNMERQLSGMSNTLNRLALLCVALSLVCAPAAPCAEPDSIQEYQIKAAFLYNFLKFVDWPKEKMGDANEPITLGIIGKDPFGQAFEPVKDKDVKDKKVVVKRFKSIADLKKLGESGKDELDRQIEAVKKCHLLFVCSSEKEYLKDIVNAVKQRPVLTVGEMQGFLEAGGISNFLVEDNKVRFEVNLTAAEHAKLKIRSQLLRLAKRVIEEKDAPEDKDK